MPCPDENSGFEYYLEPLADSEIELAPVQRKVIGDRDTLVSLVFRGREADLEAALAASSALAAMSDGYVLDGESGQIVPPDKALAWARGDYEPPYAEPPPPMRRPLVEHKFKLVMVLVVVALIVWSWFAQSE